MLGKGDFGHSGEYSGIVGCLSELDGVFHHLSGLVGELGKGGTSSLEFLGHVNGIFKGTDGIVEYDGGSRVVLLFNTSHFLNQL